MMKHSLCIIHAGMHKTGTTSIQSTFFHHLKSQKFLYLHLDTLNLTQELFVLFRPQKIETILRYHKIWNQSKTLLKQHREIVYKKLENLICQSHEVGILSAEMISDMEIEEFAQLVSFLKQFYKKIQVVAYVRSPQNYINSMMAQKIKEGLFAFDPKLFYPHYKARFEKFDYILGQDNVMFIPYIPSKLLHNDIIADFCYRMGIRTDELSGKKNANATLNLEHLSLLWFYHHYILQNSTDSFQMPINIQNLINILKFKGKYNFALHPSLTKPVLNRYCSDILWMEKRLEHKLGEMPFSLNTIIISSEKDFLVRGYKETLSFLGIEEKKYHFSQDNCFLLALKLKNMLNNTITKYPSNSIKQIENILINEMLKESLLPSKIVFGRHI